MRAGYMDRPTVHMLYGRRTDASAASSHMKTAHKTCSNLDMRLSTIYTQYMLKSVHETCYNSYSACFIMKKPEMRRAKIWT